MSNLIEQKGVLEIINKHIRQGNGIRPMVYDIKDEVRKMPVADAEVVTHGKWIMHGRVYGKKYYRCSYCRYQIASDYFKDVDFKYCPNCGTKMDRK